MPRIPDLSKWTYEAMFQSLAEKDPSYPSEFTWKSGAEVKLYNNTTFCWAGTSDCAISVYHFATQIAVVRDGSVELLDAGGARGTWGSGHRRSHGNDWTETTKRRLAYLLLANCNKNLTAYRGVLKVYDVASGGYTDYREGMLVTR